MYFNKRHGIYSSGILFIFWISLLILAVPQLIIEIVDYVKLPHPIEFLDQFKFFDYIGYFTIVLVAVILNAFADRSKPPDGYVDDDNMDETDGIQRRCPENLSSFLNRIFYHWYDSLTWTGYSRPIEMDDIWDLDYANRGKNVIPKFDKYLFSKEKVNV